MTTETKKKRGRPPTAYTQERASEILRRLAAGESLRSICKDTHLPNRETVNDWVINDTNGFASHYARARELGFDEVAEESVEISDDGRNDWIENNDPDNPGYRLNGENVQRSRLRVDTRKWYLAKLSARYADRQNIDINGSLELKQMSDDDIRAELELLTEQLKGLIGQTAVPPNVDLEPESQDE